MVCHFWHQFPTPFALVSQMGPVVWLYNGRQLHLAIQKQSNRGVKKNLNCSRGGIIVVAGYDGCLYLTITWLADTIITVNQRAMCLCLLKSAWTEKWKVPCDRAMKTESETGVISDTLLFTATNRENKQWDVLTLIGYNLEVFAYWNGWWFWKALGQGDGLDFPTCCVAWGDKTNFILTTVIWIISKPTRNLSTWN